MEKSKVYFIKEITPENVIKMYNTLNKKLNGKVAVKVHSGEKGNQNYLRPEFLKPIIEYVNGTVVECNTAYEGMRNTTEKHKELMKEHKWSDLFKVDILDSDVPDIILEIPKGKVIKENFVGKNISKYDSVLVISHFKGHPMGGYGGALKQLSIGFASSVGKRYIHCCGKHGTYEDMFSVEQNKFIESMADAASTIVDYYNKNIIYINIMCNMSVDCDCCADAKAPAIKDIGILSSLDPVAIDQACIDLVKRIDDPGKDALLERISSKNGEHIIDSAYELGIGNKEYDLINIG